MISPNWRPGTKQLRQFAAICLPGFALAGYMAHRLGASAEAGYWVAGLGGVCGLVGMAWPGFVRPLYFVLMAVTLPIGWLLSNLLLRAVFYGVFSPLGLLFRLIGRDALMLRRPASDTYWRPHDQRTDPMSYYRQG
jgi:hypothetical protein